jgi:hypothetical protein
MSTTSNSLKGVYEGWDGYHHSIVQAVRPLTPENSPGGPQLSCARSASLCAISPLVELTGLCGLMHRVAVN